VSVYARTAGGLCALVCLIGIGSLAAGTGRAHLNQIQLGTHHTAVQRLIRDRSIRSAARRAIAIDYIFLTAYWAAFIALGALLVRRGGGWAVLGGTAWVAATVTAALDLLENLRTSVILALDKRGDQLAQTQLDALRHISLAKWGASAVTIGLLAGVFIEHSWAAALAVAFLLVAFLGLAGLYQRALIRPFFNATAAVTLITAAILLIRPSVVA
jgi:hypothetical protein